MDKPDKQIIIYIVEDDPVFTNILIEIIENLAADFNKRNISIIYKTYYSSKEARFELQKNPDIILLDYYIIDDSLIPLTADEFIDNVLTGADSYIDIVIISGQEDKSLIKELKKKGIRDYISKDNESLMKLEPLLKNLIEEKLLK